MKHPAPDSAELERLLSVGETLVVLGVSRPSLSDYARATGVLSLSEDPRVGPSAFIARRRRRGAQAKTLFNDGDPPGSGSLVRTSAAEIGRDAKPGPRSSVSMTHSLSHTCESVCVAVSVVTP